MGKWSNKCFLFCFSTRGKKVVVVEEWCFRFPLSLATAPKLRRGLTCLVISKLADTLIRAEQFPANKTRITKEEEKKMAAQGALSSSTPYLFAPADWDRPDHFSLRGVGLIN